MGTGSKSGLVTIWDIREQKPFKSIDKFKGQELCSISFSNKGVLFGCSWRNSEICRVFDLRKFDQAIEEIGKGRGEETNSV